MRSTWDSFIEEATSLQGELQVASYEHSEGDGGLWVAVRGFGGYGAEARHRE